MHIKQLIGLTLFSSLLFVSGLSTESIAAGAATSEKDAAHHNGVFTGELLKTFNSGGYTYAHLKTADGDVWAAGPKTDIKASDKVSFIGKVAMIDFYSKSLDRKFKTIYFVDSYIVNGMNTAVMAVDPHKKIDKVKPAALKSFTKAKDGKTVDDILHDKDKLAGKKIKIRGQVNKYTASVMGKNWLHIRDSSSDQDITITTDASAKMNDIVLAEGKLILNKDYGYGYVYEVLIEDAKLTVE